MSRTKLDPDTALLCPCCGRVPRIPKERRVCHCGRCGGGPWSDRTCGRCTRLLEREHVNGYPVPVPVKPNLRRRGWRR